VPVPINPEQLGAPRGYSNGMLAPAGGRLLAIAGQVAWDADQQIVDDGFTEQFEQALRNVVAIVREAGGQPHHLISMTIYVVDHRQYLDELSAVGAAYRDVVGRHFPAMALVEVQALIEPGAKVEIQATAVLP
jgi:enamine deaminase RidA (YjgF/YER057c/UK114 family)